MDFTFSAEQEGFRSAVRNALATEAPPQYVRAMIEDPAGVTPELWATMADLGWLGVLVPEAAGYDWADAGLRLRFAAEVAAMRTSAEMGYLHHVELHRDQAVALLRLDRAAAEGNAEV